MKIAAQSWPGAWQAVGWSGTVPVGWGCAQRDGLNGLRNRIPSFYADPVAWLAVDALGDALESCASDVLAVRDEVGVIMVSAYCTLWTMRHVARSAVIGRMSPLRFAGASPGTAGSVSCIVFRLAGPSLTVSTAPETGLPVAGAVAASWLRSGAAAFVVVSAHDVDDAGTHRVYTAILRTDRTDHTDGAENTQAGHP